MQRSLNPARVVAIDPWFSHMAVPTQLYSSTICAKGNRQVRWGQLPRLVTFFVRFDWFSNSGSVLVRVFHPSSRRGSRCLSCALRSDIFAFSPVFRPGPFRGYLIQKTHPRLCHLHLCFHLVWLLGVHHNVQGFCFSPPNGAPPRIDTMQGLQYRIWSSFTYPTHCSPHTFPWYINLS